MSYETNSINTVISNRESNISDTNNTTTNKNNENNTTPTKNNRASSLINTDPDQELDLNDDVEENDDAFGIINEYNKNAKRSKPKVIDQNEIHLKNSAKKQKTLFNSTPKNKDVFSHFSHLTNSNNSNNSSKVSSFSVDK